MCSVEFRQELNELLAGGFVLSFLIADVVLRIIKERYGFFLKVLNWSLELD